MNTSDDPLGQEFDSIEVDPTSAPTPATSDNAPAPAAPLATAPETDLQPGYYLLSDADGRFVVDRQIGVISVKDDSTIEAERNAVHTVRMRVVEQSGASYDMDMPLRITGRVPQLVGGEDFAFTAETAPAPSVRAVGPPAVPWWSFAAPSGVSAPAIIGGDAEAPYGAVLQASLPTTEIDFIPLVLADEPPAPAPTHADWAI